MRSMPIWANLKKLVQWSKGRVSVKDTESPVGLMGMRAFKAASLGTLLLIQTLDPF